MLNIPTQTPQKERPTIMSQRIGDIRVIGQP